MKIYLLGPFVFLFLWLADEKCEGGIDELQWLLLITSCKWLHACEHDYYLCAKCYMHAMCTYAWDVYLFKSLNYMFWM